MPMASTLKLCKNLLFRQVQNIQPLDFWNLSFSSFQTNDSFLTKDSIYSSIVKCSVPYYQTDITMVFAAEKKLSANQVK